MTRTRARRLAGLALASTLLLTGCGSVPGFNPGVASRVGDDRVTTNHVDDVAASYCGAAETQLTEDQTLPNHYLLGEVAGSLTLRTAADKFLAEYGVEIDDSYDQAVAQAETQLVDLPTDQRDALIEVQGAPIYLNAVELSVGRSLLEDQGESQPTDEAAAAAGQKAFNAWLDDQDLRINPIYGVTIKDGQTALADTSLSFPLGVTATKGSAADPDSDYAATLPETHRCG